MSSLSGAHQGNGPRETPEAMTPADHTGPVEEVMREILPVAKVDPQKKSRERRL